MTGAGGGGGRRGGGCLCRQRPPTPPSSCRAASPSPSWPGDTPQYVGRCSWNLPSQLCPSTATKQAASCLSLCPSVLLRLSRVRPGLGRWLERDGPSVIIEVRQTLQPLSKHPSCPDPLTSPPLMDELGKPSVRPPALWDPHVPSSSDFTPFILSPASGRPFVALDLSIPRSLSRAQPYGRMSCQCSLGWAVGRWAEVPRSWEEAQSCGLMCVCESHRVLCQTRVTKGHRSSLQRGHCLRLKKMPRSCQKGSRVLTSSQGLISSSPEAIISGYHHLMKLCFLPACSPV